MVKIYTSLDKCPDVAIKVVVNDDAFDVFWLEGRSKMLTVEAINAIRVIEGASFIDKDTGVIQTKVGAIVAYKLSTGCKAILNTVYCLESGLLPCLINATECGPNALRLLFDLAERDGVYLLLQHLEVLDCGNHLFSVNGEYLSDKIVDLFAKLSEELL